MKNKIIPTKLIRTSLIFLIICWPVFLQGEGWVQKANFGGTARDGAVAFSIGTNGYSGLGYDVNGNYRNDFWEYSQVNNTWTQIADFGGEVRGFGIGFSIGGKGYVGTGITDIGLENDFWEYNPANNSWIQKAPFGGTARLESFAFVIGAKGYVGAGDNFTLPGTYPSDVWQYDTLSNSWTKKADFIGLGKRGSAGFSIGTKGYVCTGMDRSANYYADLWEYDSTANTWTQKADFPGGGRYGAVGFSLGSKGYIGLGAKISVAAYNDFWEYDVTANSWTQKTSYSGAGRFGAMAFTIGNKGYVGAGLDENNYPQDDFWEYTPDDITGFTEVQGSNLSFQLTPIPAHQFLSVSFSSLAHKNVELRILDINGKLVSNIGYHLSNDTSGSTIDIDCLLPGCYFIEALNGNTRMIKKFVKE